MKVRSAVRRMCRDCYVVKKKGVVYIRCKTVKKHKQRQGFHTAAGASAWEGGQTHDCGARAYGRTELASWEVGLADVSPTHSYDPVMALRSLPWLPKWASTPSPNSDAVSQVALPRGTDVPYWLSSGGISFPRPFRALILWGSSVLDYIRAGRH